eukprot:1136917-Amphidinium_carterae.2
MTKDYYDSLLALYNIKSNTNSSATTGTKRPPIETNEYVRLYVTSGSWLGRSCVFVLNMCNGG